MRKTFLTAAIAAATLATASFALYAQQPAPMNKGMGACCSAETTPGWGMMTPDERKAHQEKMMGFKDGNSCKAYMAEHHKSMEARAKEKGMKMGKDSGHGCDHVMKKS